MNLLKIYNRIIFNFPISSSFYLIYFLRVFCIIGLVDWFVLTIINLFGKTLNFWALLCSTHFYIRGLLQFGQTGPSFFRISYVLASWFACMLFTVVDIFFVIHWWRHSSWKECLQIVFINGSSSVKSPIHIEQLVSNNLFLFSVIYCLPRSKGF